MMPSLNEWVHCLVWQSISLPSCQCSVPMLLAGFGLIVTSGKWAVPSFDNTNGVASQLGPVSLFGATAMLEASINLYAQVEWKRAWINTYAPFEQAGDLFGIPYIVDSTGLAFPYQQSTCTKTHRQEVRAAMPTLHWRALCS